MRMWRLGLVVAAGGVAAFAAVWMRERRTRTVFPASQAAALLNPARRLMQSPDAMVRAFGVSAGQRVLEVGPGPGYFTQEAVRTVGDSGSVICIDLQPGMIDALLAHLPSVSRVRPLVGSAMDLPLADGSIDCAYMVAVLGEVPDAARALHELNRVLHPGGMLSIGEMLTDPDYIRKPVLRRLAWDAGLRFTSVTRQPFGYVMHFAAS